MIKVNYDYLKNRYLEFWNKENHDRPLICVQLPLNNNKNRPNEPETIKECWENTGYVITCARNSIENTYYGGEAIPVFNPNLGPDILGAIAGCEIEYGWGTSWAIHNVDDWDKLKPITFDKNNRWWQKIEEITKAAVYDSKGDYLVGITDLHAGTDGLVSLRGPENLCMDLIDNSGHIVKRINEIFSVYKEVYNRLDSIIKEKQEGTINWMSIWHPQKRWYPVSTDFSCMVSKEAYNNFIVPGLIDELNFFDAAIYHLDGPGALRHLDKILELPNLNGIQWVPGAGQDSASKWIPLLQKIQNNGKLIQIYCDISEVEILCRNLNPEGVQILVGGCKSKQESDDLLLLAVKASKK